MSTPRPKASQLGALGFAAVALFCAAFAAHLIVKMMSAKGYTSERLQPVVVAKHSLPSAVPIRLEDLTIASWPANHLPPGAISDPKLLFADNKSPVPPTTILEGEPVVPARLAGSNQGTALAALVRPGYRAVAVKADESVGRSGLVYPGAHVDLLATIRDPDGKGPSTKIAVSDIKVLAVEDRTDFETHRRPSGGDGSLSSTPASFTGTVVTLEVKPEDAEVVSLALREGVIDLALRNGSDHEQVDTKGATPIAFSAYAPSISIDMSTPTKPGAKPGQSAAASTAPQGRRPIELRATDSAAIARDRPSDTPPPSNGGGEIDVR
jgi:pilus assembly protein CpaB